MNVLAPLHVPQRRQFTLRGLLVLTFVVAVVLGAGVGIHRWLLADELERRARAMALEKELFAKAIAFEGANVAADVTAAVAQGDLRVFSEWDTRWHVAKHGSKGNATPLMCGTGLTPAQRRLRGAEYQYGHKYNQLILPTLEGTWNPQQAAVIGMLRKSGAVVEVDSGDAKTLHVSRATPPASQIAALDTLEELILGTPTPPYDLRPISGMTQLRVLFFDGPAVDDAAAQVIAQLPQLRKLLIRGPSPLTGAGLKSLATLTQLEELCLCDTQVTGADLACLSSLSKLRSLALVGEFGDEIFQHLTGLPALEQLDLRPSKVTEAGVEAFQKAAPRCKVMW